MGLNFNSFLQMPRIWLDYVQFMMDQNFITRTRHLFDRALRALPITQHSRIWPKYLAFIQKYDIPETAVRVYRRYLKVNRCSWFLFSTMWYCYNVCNRIHSYCLARTWKYWEIYRLLDGDRMVRWSCHQNGWNYWFGEFFISVFH